MSFWLVLTIFTTTEEVTARSTKYVLQKVDRQKWQHLFTVTLGYLWYQLRKTCSKYHCTVYKGSHTVRDGSAAGCWARVLSTVGPSSQTPMHQEMRAWSEPRKLHSVLFSVTHSHQHNNSLIMKYVLAGHILFLSPTLDCCLLHKKDLI